MKILIIRLDGASPDLLFENPQLVHLRRLLDLGCYGTLQGVSALGPEMGWLCLTTGMDPATLTNYQDLTQAARQVPVLWDVLALAGHNVQRMEDMQELAEPANMPKNQRKERLFALCRQRMVRLKQELKSGVWDVIAFREPVLMHVLMEFGEYHFPGAAPAQSANPFQFVVPEYLSQLDDQIGTLLEFLTDTTTVLIVSTYCAQRDGAFILVTPGLALQGVVHDVHIRDLAPTLLDLSGCPIPGSMQGQSLRALAPDGCTQSGYTLDEEELVRERLSGLGYIG